MKIDEDLEKLESKRCLEDEESKNRSCTRTGDANQPARTDPEDRPEPERRPAAVAGVSSPAAVGCSIDEPQRDLELVGGG